MPKYAYLSLMPRYYSIKFRNPLSEQDYVQVWDETFTLVCRISGEGEHTFEKLPEGFIEAVRTLSCDFGYGEMYVMEWDDEQGKFIARVRA